MSSRKGRGDLFSEHALPSHCDRLTEQSQTQHKQQQSDAGDRQELRPHGRQAGTAVDDGLGEGDEVPRREDQREPLHPGGLALDRSISAREQLEHDDQQDDQQGELGHGPRDRSQEHPQGRGEEEIEDDPRQEQPRRAGDGDAEDRPDDEEQRPGDRDQDDQAIGPDLRHRDLERRQRHHQHVLDRAVLALADQRRPGQDDRQRRDLVDDGHDAVEPGRVPVRIVGLSDDDLDRARRRVLRAPEEAGDLVREDIPDVAGADAGLLHGGRIDVDLQFGLRPARRSASYARRDDDDKHIRPIIHQAVDLRGPDRSRVLESRGIERLDQPLRQRGLVLVDEGDRRVVDFRRRSLRLGINGKREGIDDEDHEHGVALQAPQFLGPEPEDIGQLLHDHDSCRLQCRDSHRRQHRNEQRPRPGRPPAGAAVQAPW